MLIHAALLAAVLILLAWFVRNDRAEYAAFKALTRTEDRQRVFRQWTWRSFLVFTGSALAVLALLGRLDALIRVPPEFGALTARLDGDSGEGGIGWGFLIGVLVAVVAGGVAGAVLRSRLAGRDSSARPPKLLGDIAPLLPRNRDEGRWTGLMALNAGPGEELFFRLMLPLLIALVTGNAALAFVAAGLIFGLVHFYQGWVGILTTTIIGFAFAAFYLFTGTIWLPVAAHSLMNLNSMWLQPLLEQRRRDRASR